MDAVLDCPIDCESTIEEGEDSPSPKPSPEHEFIRRLQAGDEQAYHGFVERYKTRIFRLAHGILGNRAEAEEITQRVFIKVFLSIASFRGQSSLFTWVHRIAVNECYGLFRKRSATISLDTQNAGSTIWAQLQGRADPSPRWDTVVLQRDYLNQLLQALPSKDRHLLLLREVQGLSMIELAEATGMNENAVKIRLCRARQRMAHAAAQLQRQGKPRFTFGRRLQVRDWEHAQRS